MAFNNVEPLTLPYPGQTLKFVEAADHLAGIKDAEAFAKEIRAHVMT